jgi:hypothetical protein
MRAVTEIRFMVRQIKKEINMDELVSMISKKTGLSPEMSKTVINMVLDFVKKKVPALAPEIDMLVNNTSAIEGAAGALGGLFGKKKK